MKIALDYDNCYTTDPALWDAFVVAAVHKGHDVRIVTMRKPEEAIHINLPVIYTSRRAKRDYAVLYGWVPDVWIDDTPDALLYDFV